MYSEEFYQQYFEGLASSLVDIGHAPGNQHFFLNLETGSGLSELQEAVSKKLNLPCLVLDENDIVSDGSQGQKMMLRCGFAILDKVSSQDLAGIREVRQKTKKIARKIINKMLRDSRLQFDENSNLLRDNYIQLGEINQSPTPIFFKELAGWFVEFTWLVPHDITFGTDDFV